MSPNNISEDLINLYHNILLTEYERYISSGSVSASRLSRSELHEICNKEGVDFSKLIDLGLIVPLDPHLETFHSQHMAIIEKLLKLQPWHNLPPIPLEYRLILDDSAEIPAAEVSSDALTRLARERIESDLMSEPAVSIDLDLISRALELVCGSIDVVSLYPYQAEYSIEILRSLMGLSDFRTFVLSAPTGMGKTEAFLIPALTFTIITKLRGLKGCKVLLVYPRKSLERDQLQKILRIISRINQELEDPITVGIDDGDSIKNRNILKWELEHRKNKRKFFRGLKCPLCEASLHKETLLAWELGEEEGVLVKCDNGHEIDFITEIKEDIWSDLPDIIITNLHTLNRRLMYPEAKGVFSGEGNRIEPRLVVLDEAHVYRGIIGGFAHYILRRLGYRLTERSGKGPIWVVSSATMGNPTAFAKRLLGEDRTGRIYHRRYFDKDRDKSAGKRLQLHLLLAPKPDTTGEWLLQQTLLALSVWALSAGKKFISFVDSVESTQRIWNLLVKTVMKRYNVGEQERHLSPHRLGATREENLLGYPYSWLALVVNLVSNRLGQSVERTAQILGDRNSYLGKQGQSVYKDVIEPEIVRRLRDEGDQLLLFHHAKLSRKRRYEVEEALKTSAIGVISTSTLELGIDIGDVSAVVQYRPPRAGENYVQRVGRAGRSADSLRVGLGILVLTNNPNDLWYAYGGHFEEFIRGASRVNVAVSNRRVRRWSVIFALLDLLANEGHDVVLTSLARDLRDERSLEGKVHLLARELKRIENLIAKNESTLHNLVNLVSEILGITLEEAEGYIAEFISDLDKGIKLLESDVLELIVEDTSSPSWNLVPEGDDISRILESMRDAEQSCKYLHRKLEEHVQELENLIAREKTTSVLPTIIEEIEQYLTELEEPLEKVRRQLISLQSSARIDMVPNLPSDVVYVAIALDNLSGKVSTALGEIKKCASRDLKIQFRGGRVEIKKPKSDESIKISQELLDAFSRSVDLLQKPISLIKKITDSDDYQDMISKLNDIMVEFCNKVEKSGLFALADRIRSLQIRRR